MAAWRYGMSLFMFNLISHSFAAPTHDIIIKLNMRRDIPYLQAIMYYSLYISHANETNYPDFYESSTTRNQLLLGLTNYVHLTDREFSAPCPYPPE